MTGLLSPVPANAAHPLSLLHTACFPDDPWNCEIMARVLGLTGVFGWIAWAGDSPGGFVLARDLHDECEILALGVLVEYRRRGIARQLMDATAGAAVARGLTSLVLEVAADNEPARRLYTGFGFATVGRRPRYYRRRDEAVDALILRLPLRPLGACS